MSVVQNISDIKARIHMAARGVARNPADIQLVAVSKKQPPGKIHDALIAGLRLFGENRVQEAQERWTDLKKEYPDLKLHLIGPLQTNKVKEAVALFDVIETVDREKLAQELVAEMKKQNRFLPCFIQVNTGEEEQKSGVAPSELPALIKLCRELGLSITGLMCLPPEEEPSALHFAFLGKLAATHGLKELSMGMSGDFEKAIPLGATYVRVGTGIFGARE